MNERSEPQWDLATLGQNLQSSRELTENAILGVGAVYEVGRFQTRLEIYPTANHVTLRTRQVVLGLSNVTLVGTDEATGLILESQSPEGRAILWLTPDGSFHLHQIYPPTFDELMAKEQGHSATTSSSGKSSESAGAAPSPSKIGQPQTSSGDTSEGRKLPQNRTEIGTDDDEPVEEIVPANTPVLERQERGVYSGRSGKKINYKTVHDRKAERQHPGQEIMMLVCEFMLHMEDGSAQGKWIKISAFRQDAQKCQEQLKGGSPVRIVGYKHIRIWTDKQGVEHTKEDVYAGHVSIT